MLLLKVLTDHALAQFATGVVVGAFVVVLVDVEVEVEVDVEVLVDVDVLVEVLVEVVGSAETVKSPGVTPWLMQ